MFISFEDMAKFVDEDEGSVWIKEAWEPEEETLADHLKMFAMSTSPRVDAYLATKGFVVNEQGLHLLDQSALSWIGNVTSLIQYDYDTMGDRPREKSSWGLFGLSGDDDVDYNSSYPSTLFDVWNKLAGEEYQFTDPVDGYIDMTRQDVVKYMEALMWDRKEAKYD